MRKKKLEYEHLIRQISINREQERYKEAEMDGGVPSAAPPQRVLSPPSHPPPLLSSQQQASNVLYHRPTLQLGNRPPRLKPFSIRRLIRKLWGNEAGTKHNRMGDPLPNRMEGMPVMHRYTSSPGPSMEKKEATLKRYKCSPKPAGGTKMWERYGTPPMLLGGSLGAGDLKVKGHTRRRSDELKSTWCGGGGGNMTRGGRVRKGVLMSRLDLFPRCTHFLP